VHAALSRALGQDLETKHRLSLSEYEVLLNLSLAPEGYLRMSELADRALISTSGLTRLVERLERRGLVERRPCPDDARGALAAITETGQRLFAVARRDHLAAVRTRFLAHFSADELDLLAAFWDRLLSGAAGREPATRKPC
jgi:DNA-binding MarR family transcriptional regulator